MTEILDATMSLSDVPMPTLALGAKLARLLNMACAPPAGEEFTSILDLHQAMERQAQAHNNRRMDPDDWAFPWAMETDEGELVLSHITQSGRLRILLSTQEIIFEFYSQEYERRSTQDWALVIRVCLNEVGTWSVVCQRGSAFSPGRGYEELFGYIHRYVIPLVKLAVFLRDAPPWLLVPVASQRIHTIHAKFARCQTFAAPCSAAHLLQVRESLLAEQAYWKVIREQLSPKMS